MWPFLGSKCSAVRLHYKDLTSARLIDEREAQRVEVVAVRIPQAIGYAAAECVPAQAEVRDVHETGQFGRYLTDQIVVGEDQLLQRLQSSYFVWYLPIEQVSAKIQNRKVGDAR